MTEVGTAPLAEFNYHWPSNFSQQYLVRFSVQQITNMGGGHQVGIFTNQELAFQSTTPMFPEVAPGTKTGAIYMHPPRLPSRLELIGPAPGSSEVRGVLFSQQPLVKVVVPMALYSQT